MSEKKHFYNERGEKMAAETVDTGEISKSQRKREANELLDLGKLLVIWILCP